ncbi:hypothetical protein NKH14_17280 [Mesorhizobium sp. M1380]|uniref:hypothetical protein n=1 Tax=Mesorhizobium sp. M1380 TaxID=2957093 RepID=UPI0033350D9F
MTPTLVHRYSWPIAEAIEHLLGEDAGDAGAWLIRVEGDELVIDIIIGDIAQASAEVVDIEHARQQRTSNEAAKINTAAPEADAAPTEPPRKGGPLAQRAAISCGEKGFWTFIGKKFGVEVQTAEEAAAWLKAQCGVNSRIDLDYDEGKANNFHEIDTAYRLWLEGYD